MEKRRILLEALQDNSASLTELAQTLGYDLSYISLIYAGDRPVTERFCARVIGRMPHHAGLAWDAREEIVAERWQAMRAAAAASE